MNDPNAPSTVSCCECTSGNILEQDLSAPRHHISQPIPRTTFHPFGADRIFKAKTILTMNEQMPETTAIAVRDGKIVALGQEALEKWIGPQTEIVDYGDQVIIPGFIETHSHPLFYGLCLRMVNVGYTEAKTRAEVLALIAAAAKKSDRPWLFAWNFDPSLLDDGTPLSRQELDAICPDKNLAVIHNSLHLGYVNSKTLATVGISRDMPDPVGGKLVRDAAGELTGELRELAAIHLVQSKVPKLKYEETLESGWLAARAYQKQGITSITDAGLGLATGVDDFHFYGTLLNDPKFPVRLVGFPVHTLFGKWCLPSNFGDERFKVGATKFIVDGSVHGHTASFSIGYYDRPQSKGICTVEPEKFKKDILDLHHAGQQVAIHANGDAAIQLAIDAIEEALIAYPRPDHRHRIEHCQAPTEAQIEQMARLGILPNFFVNHVYYWGEVHRKYSLGPERAAKISPTQWAKKYDLPFTFHSDAPVTMPTPLLTLWIAVNRLTSEGHVLGPDQRISAYDALRALTLHAAYFNFEENIKGSIEVGKLADLAVLSENPLTVDAMKIKDIQVHGTVLNGVPMVVE